MAQYIDKSTLIAEIEKTYKFHEKRGNEHDSSICDVLYGLSHRIGTLEVKELDLEKEIDDAWDNTSDAFVPEQWLEFETITKHFFELGLKAQKGE